MIQLRPVCDDPDLSGKRAKKGRWSQGPVVHQKGAWMKREEEEEDKEEKEEEEEEEEEDAIES